MQQELCVLFCIIFGFTSAVNAVNTKSFPVDFLFGTATASYQIEGAWNVNGKGENIWDRFTHQHPDKILDGSNGDIACDSYHKIREDVALMKNMGVQFYRFSLSWSRILPTGRSYKVNPDGIRYYNELLDVLIENKIIPMVTLFHWDTPQPLQDLGGFTNSLFANWFEEYVRVAFENFGNKVPYWITFNEPLQICYEGYGNVQKAPAYNSTGIGDYLCGHNLLKAHARAYHIYDKEYRSKQNGKIGITINGVHMKPKTESDEDKEAAQRLIEFSFGWFADPIFHPNGDYPEVMKTFIEKRSLKEGFKKSRLPKFSREEVDYIKGTSDFFGLNHYTTTLVENTPDADIGVPAFGKDARIKLSNDPSWPGSASSWLNVVPEGFTEMLKWISNRYGDVEIYVTENGFSDKGELNDQKRIEYYQLYLSALLDAIDDKVNVKAYTAWSLLDNFEWLDGYENRFGLYHVDFNDPGRKRTPKESVQYYTNVIKDRKLPQNI